MRQWLLWNTFWTVQISVRAQEILTKNNLKGGWGVASTLLVEVRGSKKNSKKHPSSWHWRRILTGSANSRCAVPIMEGVLNNGFDPFCPSSKNYRATLASVYKCDRCQSITLKKINKKGMTSYLTGQWSFIAIHITLLSAFLLVEIQWRLIRELFVK